MATNRRKERHRREDAPTTALRQATEADRRLVGGPSPGRWFFCRESVARMRLPVLPSAHRGSRRPVGGASPRRVHAEQNPHCSPLRHRHKQPPRSPLEPTNRLSDYPEHEAPEPHPCAPSPNEPGRTSASFASWPWTLLPPRTRRNRCSVHRHRRRPQQPRTLRHRLRPPAGGQWRHGVCRRWSPPVHRPQPDHNDTAPWSLDDND